MKPIKGQRYRVVKEPALLSGMKPITGGCKGWSMRLEVGTILTCLGRGRGWGSDSVPIYTWADADGRHIADYCEFRPDQGSFFTPEPKDGYLELVEP